MSQLNSVLKKLCTCLGTENVLSKKVDLAAYRDSVHLSGRSPSAVIFPQDAAKVSEVLKILHHYQIPCIPRGAGTNLCGDTLSFGPTIIMEMSKMDRILEVNILDRYIAVEPGVPNSAVQKALAPHGYFFAPDPASFGVSTIGGNIGENAGGMRCVKYGVTSDNVIGLEIVLSDGRVIRHKGPFPDDGGYNLTGLVHGSEGTFGVITKAWLRMVKLPEEVKTMVAVFATLEDSVATVSRIIGRGMIPSALEIIDHLAIQALEETRPMGYPINAEAVLLIEVDGFTGTLDAQVERINAICQENHVSEVRIAKTEEERQLLWLGRREALNCFVSKRPTYAQEDVAVPRARLPEMLNIIKEISRKYSLVVASVCHAGDGNFHPTIIYDDKDEDGTKRAHSAFGEMMKRAVALGGTISGEHGIGVEKLKGMKLLFSAEELDFMERVKLAFDPPKILNPGKVIPDKFSEPSMEKPGQGLNESNQESFLHSLEREKIEHIINKFCILIKPKSSLEVAKVVKLAGAYQMKISPMGKGDSAANIYGAACKAIIDMSYLNEVIEIDGENLTVTVQGGVVLDDLQEMLREKGFIFPLDPWETVSPTIGGLIAANSAGSLRLKYGTSENLVLGLEAVTAEGKIINYGGKTIKNVAGYDLRKLFIGSWGTLGVITKVTLKIFPLPEKALSRIYCTEDYQVFLDCICAVQEKDVQLTGFDFGVKDDQYYMHLLISGQNEAVIRQAEILTRLFKELNLSEKLQPVEEKEDPYLNSGKDFYQKYFSQNKIKFIMKSSLFFSYIPNWLKTMQLIQGRENLSLSGLGAGGIFYTFFSGDDISLDTMEEISLSLKESLPDGIHTAYDLNMKKIREEGSIFNQGINKDIKESLDPDQLFLPGRNPGLFL